MSALIDNVFELIIIAIALTYTRCAMLPVLVACNILAYTAITFIIERIYPIHFYPGYELFYSAGAFYFLIMGALFASRQDNIYRLIGVLLLLQAIASAMMLVTDMFADWHKVVNEKVIVCECILVWLSAIRGCDD